MVLGTSRSLPAGLTHRGRPAAWGGGGGGDLSMFPLLPAKPLRSRSKVLRRSGPARKEGKKSLVDSKNSLPKRSKIWKVFKLSRARWENGPIRKEGRSKCGGRYRKWDGCQISENQPSNRKDAHHWAYLARSELTTSQVLTHYSSEPPF